MSMNCPICKNKLRWKDLTRDKLDEAPLKLGLAWPRVYCRFCGVELRSSTLSLIVGGLVFIAGISFFLAAILISEHPASRWIMVAGFLSIAIVPIWVHQFHRFVAKLDPNLSLKRDRESRAILEKHH